MSKNTTWALICFIAVSTGMGETYFVSPQGSDSGSGLTPGSAWRTLAKVNSTSFSPGDEIRFERGGTWRESLAPLSSGTPGNPIVFADYGEGPLPRFLGSELLANGDFEWVTGTTYRVAVPAEVTCALVDQAFLYGGTPVLSIDTLQEVHEFPSSWLWQSGALYINTGGPDPRTDGRVYRGVVREDIILAQGVSNLVFRNLSVHESARYDAGYGIRIQNSRDILMEDCQAYHCAKHHFGVINTTGFSGRRLYGAYAMPAQGNDGASTYVPYSDATVNDTTSEWLDCTAEHMEDTYSGISYRAFVTHGEGIGSVLISNLTSHGAGVSTGGGTTVIGGTIHDADLSVYSNRGHVTGLHITGPEGHIDLFGNQNLIENCLVEGSDPRVHYKAMVTCYGTSNTLRNCTLVMSGGAPSSSTCIALAARDTHTRWYGNIMMAVQRVFRLWGDGLTGSDVAYADYNRYNSSAVFVDGTSEWTLPEWRSLGYDSHSGEGDPGFLDEGSDDYRLSESSACIDAMTSGDFPPMDFNRVSRPLDGDASGGAIPDLGAFEFAHAGSDTDGDGMSDADEVAADTDARDPQSKLAFRGVGHEDGLLRIDWIGGRSVTQFVEYTPDLLLPDAWQRIHTNVPPTPVSNSLQHAPVAPAGGYRLNVVQ